MTLDELTEAYITRWVRAHAHRPDVAERDVRYKVKRYLAAWRGRKLSQITRKDVIQLHDDMGAKYKHTANRVMQLLRRMFNFAIRTELWSGANPAAGIAKFHEAPRKTFLSAEQLAQLGTELRNEPSQDLHDFVCLALWTGACKSDVLAMRWQDVALTDNRWTVPDPRTARATWLRCSRKR
jgi:integrase